METRRGRFGGIEALLLSRIVRCMVRLVPSLSTSAYRSFLEWARPTAERLLRDRIRFAVRIGTYRISLRSVPLGIAGELGQLPDHRLGLARQLVPNRRTDRQFWTENRLFCRD